MKYIKNNSFLPPLILSLGIFITPNIWASGKTCNTDNSIEIWHECSGTVAYKKDQQYQGYFRKGKPDGVGIATFANGYKYIGEFKNGEYEGLGAITDKSEKILQGGVWEAGRFVQSKQIDLTQFTQGGSSGPIKVTELPTPQEPPKQLYQAQATPPSIRDQPRIPPPLRRFLQLPTLRQKLPKQPLRIPPQNKLQIGLLSLQQLGICINVWPWSSGMIHTRMFPNWITRVKTQGLLHKISKTWATK